MKIRTLMVPAVGGHTRRSANPWKSKVHLDRVFSTEARTSGPAHVAEVLPLVLRNLTASKGGVQ